MSEPRGKFGWYELMTTDIAAAQKFYKMVVGCWTSQNVGSPQMPYSTFNVNGFGIAGVMDLPEQAGRIPAWVGYIHVDDVDAYAAKVASTGGAIHRGPIDVPGMLRFCVVTDPQGAPFVLFTSNPAMVTPPGRPAFNSPGTISWHELMASDGPAAMEYYTKLFGWTEGEGFDMGPMGRYLMFSEGDVPVGGMMTKPPEAPHPFWNYYIMVDGIDAAVERIQAAGGTVMNGPHQVPGDSWIVQAKDPQGAHFCLNSASK